MDLVSCQRRSQKRRHVIKTASSDLLCLEDTDDIDIAVAVKTDQIFFVHTLIVAERHFFRSSGNSILLASGRKIYYSICTYEEHGRDKLDDRAATCNHKVLKLERWVPLFKVESRHRSDGTFS